MLIDPKKSSLHIKDHTLKRLKNASPRTLNIATKTAIVVVILLAGLVAYGVIRSSKPTTMRRPPEIAAPYVETTLLAVSSQIVKIDLMGTVIAKTKVDLKAQVSGRIIKVNPEFIEGGVIPANTPIVILDPRDYELAVQNEKAEVATADYNLKMEEGQPVVAISEWEILKDSEAFKKVKNTDLALRKPQLAKAKADLESAKASLAQAQLNLARTQLTLPYAAMVLTKNTAVGSQVGTQEIVATMVDVDAYYVQASIAADNLAWLEFATPDNPKGSKAVIYYGSGHTIEGYLVKVLGNLEENGRMARVLIEIDDPMNLKQTTHNKVPLLIGEYVRVTLDGIEAKDVIAIDRTLLRDSDTIWLLSDANKLEIVPVDVIWRAKNQIYITDVDLAGREIVMTTIATPINGMQLRVVTD